MRFKIAHLSDPGKADVANEDYYNFDESLGLFIVADGLGGYAGGEIASRIAAESVMKKLAEPLMNYKMPTQEVEKEISDAVMEANDLIVDERNKNESVSRMGTTLSLVLIKHDYSYLAHMGDSRIFFLETDGITLNKNGLMDDDSPVWSAYDRGEISIETAITSHQKGVIKRYLGKEKGQRPTIQFMETRYAKKFLLSTDGLTDNVLEKDIGMAMKNNNPEETVRLLLSMAKKPEKVARMYSDYYEKNKDVLGWENMDYHKALNKLGGKDNITIIAVEVIR